MSSPLRSSASELAVRFAFRNPTVILESDSLLVFCRDTITIELRVLLKDKDCSSFSFRVFSRKAFKPCKSPITAPALIIVCGSMANRWQTIVNESSLCNRFFSGIFDVRYASAGQFDALPLVATESVEQ